MSIISRNLVAVTSMVPKVDAIIRRLGRSVLRVDRRRRERKWGRIYSFTLLVSVLSLLPSREMNAQVKTVDEQILAIHLQEFRDLTKGSSRLREAHQIAVDILEKVPVGYSQKSAAYLIIPNIFDGDNSYSFESAVTDMTEATHVRRRGRTITDHILVDRQPFLLVDGSCSGHPAERYLIPVALDDESKIRELWSAFQYMPEGDRDAFVFTERERFNLQFALLMSDAVTNADRREISNLFLSDSEYRWFLKGTDEGLPLVFSKIDQQGSGNGLQLSDSGSQSPAITVLHANSVGGRRTLPNLIIKRDELKTVRKIIRLGRSRSRKVAVDVEIKEVGFQTLPSDLEIIRNALRISLADSRLTGEYCSIENPTSPDFSNRLTFLGECREEVAEFPIIQAFLRSEEYQLVATGERYGSFFLTDQLIISEAHRYEESLYPLARLSIPLYISKLGRHDRLDKKDLFAYSLKLEDLAISAPMDEIMKALESLPLGDRIPEELSIFFDDPRKLADRAADEGEMIFGLGAGELRLLAKEAESFNEILNPLWDHVRVASELMRQVQIDVVRWQPPKPRNRRGDKETENEKRRAFVYVYSYLKVKSSRVRNWITDADRPAINIRVQKRIILQPRTGPSRSVGIQIIQPREGAYDTELWQ